MLLAIAMVLTMMPALAFADDASSDVVFSVLAKYGTDTVELGKSITNSWMEENKIEPQVFPFASQKGKKWEYVVAEGPSFVETLKKVFGTNNLDSVRDAKFDIGNGFYLTIGDLLDNTYTSVFKCVDENEEMVTGPFTSLDNKDKIIKTKPITTAEPVVPIIATKSASYSTYEDACKALDDGSWKEKTDDLCKAYVGGEEGEQTLWDGTQSGDDEHPKAQTDQTNYNGKFSLEFNNNDKKMTILVDENPIKNPTKLKMSAVTVSKPTGANAVLPLDTDDMDPANVVLATAATWTSNDETVAKVDNAGHITPFKAGTCTVTANMFFADYVCKAEVTVAKSALAPLAVTNLKATNKKTRKATLTWTTSDKASGYYIYRSTKKSSGYKKVKTLKKNASSYTSGKLTKKKTYYYKVVAYNSNGKTTAGPVKVKISK